MITIFIRILMISSQSLGDSWSDERASLSRVGRPMYVRSPGHQFKSTLGEHMFLLIRINSLKDRTRPKKKRCDTKNLDIGIKKQRRTTKENGTKKIADRIGAKVCGKLEACGPKSDLLQNWGRKSKIGAQKGKSADLCR